MEKRLQTLNADQRKLEWAERIRECRSSGESVRVWCQENGVKEKTYYYWQRKIFQELAQEEVSFAEVSVPIQKENLSIAATLESGGFHVEILSGADAETIQAIIQALKSC